MQVHNLTIRAKGKVLLENTTLTITAGRRYGLVGPNGKGKSTLLRMIARRQVPVPETLDVLLVEQVWQHPYLGASDTAEHDFESVCWSAALQIISVPESFCSLMSTTYRPCLDCIHFRSCSSKVHENDSMERYCRDLTHSCHHEYTCRNVCELNPYWCPNLCDMLVGPRSHSLSAA